MVVSVITVVYNGADTLGDTIKSVLSKKTDAVEYIVIDGGSKDGTQNIIKKFSDKIDYWVSEADNGIYDAMNKGIGVASGTYMCFINSGDTLAEIPFNSLASSNNADMICFPITINGCRIKYPKLNWKFKITNTLPHQGVYYKKQPALKYNTRYKVFADYALNADYVLSKKNIKLLSSPVVANHNLDGISNNKTSSKELFEMIKEKFGFAQVITSFLYFKFRGLYYRFHFLCL